MQQGKAGWIQASDFQKGLKKRYNKMYLREQVVLFVTAGVTLSHVFSLRLVCFLRLCLP